jgi:hypothetical protein
MVVGVLGFLLAFCSGMCEFRSCRYYTATAAKNEDFCSVVRVEFSLVDAAGMAVEPMVLRGIRTTGLSLFIFRFQRLCPGTRPEAY